MCRLLCCVLVIGVMGLASCSQSEDQQRLAQLESELAEMQEALQAQQAAGQQAPAEQVAPREPAHGAGDALRSPDDSAYDSGTHTPSHGHSHAGHDHPPGHQAHGEHGTRSGHDAHHHGRGHDGHGEHRGGEVHSGQRASGHGADEQEAAVRPSGTIIGEITSMEDGGRKHIKIEVLAPGEKKAREYFVYNKPKLLEAVRTAKPGDRVEVSWVQTNHGPAIETFEVLE